MRELMEENPKLADELMSVIESGNRLDDADKPEEARKIYFEAWEQLPENKTDWSLFSQWIADSIFNGYFKEENYIEAKKWAKISYESRPSEIETECLMKLGEVHFEEGDFDVAYNWFKKAYEIGKDRAFREHDKKYLKFFKSR